MPDSAQSSNNGGCFALTVILILLYIACQVTK
jgi:hypothetical protein